MTPIFIPVPILDSGGTGKVEPPSPVVILVGIAVILFCFGLIFDTYTRASSYGLLQHEDFTAITVQHCYGYQNIQAWSWKTGWIGDKEVRPIVEGRGDKSMTWRPIFSNCESWEWGQMKLKAVGGVQ